MASSGQEDRRSVKVADPHIESAPHRLGGMLLRLGPGMIIAGSIVGSGELIATTKVGAVAGFTLLWLILLGCGIKVFAQIELGRHAVAWSETTLSSLDKVPGPRLVVNWILWYWVIMTALIISQQGGIVGGIGQALALAAPLTDQGEEHTTLQREAMEARVALAVLQRRAQQQSDPATDAPDAESADQEQLADRMNRLQSQLKDRKEPADPYLWAVLITLPTSVMLLFGRYKLVQSVATVLVASFTIMTIGTLVYLQLQPDWAVTGTELVSGLKFRIPTSEAASTAKAIGTALAAFGIIGVGASELIQYPYWCLEKGYAKSTGPRDGSDAWVQRARGWMRVMQVDAWASMLVYTFATIVFYLLGAAVLWRTGLNPEGGDMVATLTEMYRPVFGDWAPSVFLFGAFAVLYSTFFVAAGGNGRMISDWLGVAGLVDNDEESRLRRARYIAAVWPWVAVLLYWTMQAPVAMVLASGIGQTLMLPMLGIAALWFRYRRSDEHLKPGRLFDLGLWISTLGFFIATGWVLWDKGLDLIRILLGPEAS